MVSRAFRPAPPGKKHAQNPAACKRAVPRSSEGLCALRRLAVAVRSGTLSRPSQNGAWPSGLPQHVSLADVQKGEWASMERYKANRPPQSRPGQHHNRNLLALEICLTKHHRFIKHLVFYNSSCTTPVLSEAPRTASPRGTGAIEVCNSSHVREQHLSSTCVRPALAKLSQ